ncbi:M23 family metallopeptidase [Desulfobaculum bizertense]|uniref:Murein DD-endopeptidase MepM and murein hydrolase activator NlpD, contain LysM domain n=1 Tax=Desulfobaculum bizertense DSM 18034 TaxID=1121442 RepID=A0A1T4X1Z2_9BACT|nr:M23 family metallopeptidase [Desulfobaculum bizertense]SKA82871.1 Murein DD-endopeptidase MepM and murein hydrolase activator NlpD, contain LysM domain [Desulfobaculum bizertense DSM 18034]
MSLDQRQRRLYLLSFCALCMLAAASFIPSGIAQAGVAGAASKTSTAKQSERLLFEREIKPGDSLSTMLSNVLAPPEVHKVSQACRGVFRLNKLSIGQPYRVWMEKGRFSRLEYSLDDWEQLRIDCTGGKYTAKIEALPLEVEVLRMSGTVEQRQGYTQAVRAAGGNRELMLRLADIFAFKFNAWRDLKKGDSFVALVEHKKRRGKTVGYGRIFSASFTKAGKEYEAYWYRSDDGRASYYNGAGENLQPYLRAPLPMYVVSSGYNARRLHPVTGRRQPHYAIDYAAPSGTPIYAAADGRVNKVQQDRLAGRYIRIQHDAKYETMYMHMSGFAKGLKAGDNVVQGQIIGYVGSSGRATGPHLDFRLRRYGRLINPRMNHDLASAGELSKWQQSAMRRRIASYRVRMRSPQMAATALPRGWDKTELF